MRTVSRNASINNLSFEGDSRVVREKVYLVTDTIVYKDFLREKSGNCLNILGEALSLKNSNTSEDSMKLFKLRYKIGNS